MPSADLIVSEARTWVGVPWRHQGMTRVGVDCGGLILAVGLGAGVLNEGMRADPRLKKFASYGREPVGDFLEACDIFFDQTDEELEPGMVVAMRFMGHPRHAGIVGSHPSGGLSLIHAYQKSVVEHILDARWRKRIVARYRWRDV